MEVILIIVVLLVCIYNIVIGIPGKLKAQKEKEELYVKELYIRFNRLEEKLKVLEKKIDENNKEQ